MIHPTADPFYADTPLGRLKGYRYGSPDAPAIIVQGGISATGQLWKSSGSGWWQALHPLFKHLNHQVISFDYLGGLGGSECPETPLKLKQHSTAFKHALRHTNLHAWVGGSFGGVLGLQFAADHPCGLQRLSVIGAAHQPSMHTALLRYFQQAFVQRCPDKQTATILARALAMMTYRTADEFERRFADADDAFQYLLHQGEKLITQNGHSSHQVFTHLTPLLNDYRIDVSTIEARVQLIDFQQDAIAPPHLVAELAQQLRYLSSRTTINSPFGHDGFIKSVSDYRSQLTAFLTPQEPELL